MPCIQDYQIITWLRNSFCSDLFRRNVHVLNFAPSFCGKHKIWHETDPKSGPGGGTPMQTWWGCSSKIFQKQPLTVANMGVPLACFDPYSRSYQRNAWKQVIVTCNRQRCSVCCVILMRRNCHSKLRDRWTKYCKGLKVITVMSQTPYTVSVTKILNFNP